MIAPCWLLAPLLLGTLAPALAVGLSDGRPDAGRRGRRLAHRVAVIAAAAWGPALLLGLGLWAADGFAHVGAHVAGAAVAGGVAWCAAALATTVRSRGLSAPLAALAGTLAVVLWEAALFAADFVLGSLSAAGAAALAQRVGALSPYLTIGAALRLDPLRWPLMYERLSRLGRSYRIEPTEWWAFALWAALAALILCAFARGRVSHGDTAANGLGTHHQR